MKKKAVKKLTLTKETMRSFELQTVHGGSNNQACSWSCHVTTSSDPEAPCMD